MTDDIKNFQWSLVFNYQKNGMSVSENFTVRTDDKEQFETFVKEKREELPKQAFPNDSGNTAVSPSNAVEGTPTCSVHQLPMSFKQGVAKSTGKPYAFWGCDTRLPNGDFCRAKPNKS